MMTRMGKKILKLRDTLQWYEFYLIKELRDVKKKTEWCPQAFLPSGPKLRATGSAKKDQNLRVSHSTMTRLPFSQSSSYASPSTSLIHTPRSGKDRKMNDSTVKPGLLSHLRKESEQGYK